jgi:uncharacterized repeat protein (TIGR03803 family)
MRRLSTVLAVFICGTGISFARGQQYAARDLGAPHGDTAADREKVLYAFNGGKDGFLPFATLIFDAGGNLYGATNSGGNYQCDPYFGCGTVFELQPGAQGKWSKTVLHTFSGKDGAYPSASLIFDTAGNLYGTTLSGGGADGYGTVFKLAPGVNGRWTETVLHIFNSQDGGLPNCSLIFDAAGDLYGTTQTGGAYGYGTVFKLAPGVNGKWTETVLHSFNGNDGNQPASALIFDSLGNLYGTTEAGGTRSYFSGYGGGTVFKLAPGADGKWTHTLLFSFSLNNGEQPASSLVLDAAGNLYGTTVWGGDLTSFPCLNYGCGTVFRLAPEANGGWTEEVLHSFNGVDGFSPYAAVIFDAAGNLYGTTWAGGNVFKLTPGTNGEWTETVLHTFNGSDGLSPQAGLIFDASGNLYGATDYGGKLNGCYSQYGDGCGVVFEILP